MKIPRLMIEELNTTIDVLEECAKTRSQLIDTLLEILDDRDTAIDDMNSEISRLRCRIKDHALKQNGKRAN